MPLLVPRVSRRLLRAATRSAMRPECSLRCGAGKKAVAESATHSQRRFRRRRGRRRRLVTRSACCHHSFPPSSIENPLAASSRACVRTHTFRRGDRLPASRSEADSAPPPPLASEALENGRIAQRVPAPAAWSSVDTQSRHRPLRTRPANANLSRGPGEGDVEVDRTPCELERKLELLVVVRVVRLPGGRFVHGPGCRVNAAHPRERVRHVSRSARHAGTVTRNVHVTSPIGVLVKTGSPRLAWSPDFPGASR